MADDQSPLGDVHPPRGRHVVDSRQLHQRLLARDESVLDELYQQFSGTVYGVALRVTSNSSAADDITQSVFIDVWTHPERWDPDRGALRSWLTTVAHRRAVHWTHREQAMRRRDGRLPTPAPPPDVEEAVQAVLITEHVRTALAGLDEDERRVIRLTYFGARTYRQVAVELGLSEGAVKSRVRASLAQLANTLQSELAGPGRS